MTYVDFAAVTNATHRSKRDNFMADWETVIYAKTEGDFEQKYASLRTKYSQQHTLINYIHNNKYPKRQQFAKAWTSKHRHLGHIVTSRAESGHSRFKQWLAHNHHDLLDIKDRWASLTKVFLTDYRADLARERDRIPHSLRVTRWNRIDITTTPPQVIERVDPELNNQIVARAIRLLVHQLELARDHIVNNKPCTGQFESIHGIPCYHSVRQMANHNVTVRKEHFHRH